MITDRLKSAGNAEPALISIIAESSSFEPSPYMISGLFDQGDHRGKVRPILVKLGFEEDSIEEE